MNKYLGHINTILFSPAGVESAGGVDSPAGKEPGMSPESENFYVPLRESDKGPAKGGGSAGKASEGGDEQPDFSGDSKPVKGSKEEKLRGEIDDEAVKISEEIQDPDGEVEVEKKVEEPKPALLKLDPETIAELRKGLGGEKKVESEQPAKLSPQQLKEMLNPVEVSVDTLKSLGFENPTNEQIVGFQNFANSVTKNAVSIARVMIQQKAKEFEAALGPLAAHHAETTAKSSVEQFFTFAKDLNPEKHGKIVRLAAMEVNPTKADGSEKSPQEIMKEVAEISRATLKSLGVEVESPANPGAGGDRQVPKPNKFAPSGRSGGDNNGQRGKPNDAEADIYRR